MERKPEYRQPGMGVEVYGDRRSGGTAAPGHVPEVLNPLLNRMPAPIVTRNQMRRQADRGLNLVTILALLMKRRWLILGLFAVLFAPVLVYVFTMPNKYEAETKLILKKSRPEAAATPVIGEAEVAAEIELLKSHELYNQVVRQTVLAGKAAPDRRAIAEAIGQLESNLKIQQVGKTNIISLRNTANSAEVAAKVPNLLASLYLKKHIEVHGNGGTAQFFDERTASYQQQLENAQKALTHFRQTGDVSLINEQKQAYLRRATDLKAALEEADGQARDAEERLRLLAKQRGAQPLQVETGSRVVRTSALADRLKGTLIDLQNKRADLLTKYDPQYRLVKDVDQQIAETRAALEKESQPQLADTSHAPNPLRQSLEAESLRLESQAAGLRARRAALAADLSEYRARQSRLEEMTANHNDLERSVKIAEENYLLYQRKLEEARLGDALDRSRILNVAILEAAEVPVLPAAQHRAYLLIFGFFASGFGALGAAFITDYLERNLPARAPAGGQRSTDRDEHQSLPAPAPAPQYYRRRETPRPTVVEVESTAVATRGDAWRELFDKRSRGTAEQAVDQEDRNGTQS
ncbi:MAG: hypothetical protein K2X03_17760 [Bryobacteraceae bacterium]|nr:hypothetical protein [Bryobacteraceae bacterium]